MKQNTNGIIFDHEIQEKQWTIMKNQEKTPEQWFFDLIDFQKEIKCWVEYQHPKK